MDAKELAQLQHDVWKRQEEKTPQQRATESLGHDATPEEVEFLEEMGLL